MKSVAKIKIEEAKKNAESFIQQMTYFDDKKLEKHLDLFQKQKAMAFKQQNHEAFELLDLYEWQVIQARVLKMEMESKIKKQVHS